MNEDHPNCKCDGFFYRAHKDTMNKHLEDMLNRTVERVANTIRDMKLQDALKNGVITVIEEEVQE